MTTATSDCAFDLVHFTNALTADNATAWVRGRLSGHDPYFPDTDPHRRDLVFRTVLQSPNVSPIFQAAVQLAVSEILTGFMRGDKWQEPETVIPALHLAEATLIETAAGHACGAALAAFAKRQGKLSDLHSRCLFTAIALGCREAFTDNYLTRLYSEKIVTLPAYGLRAAYESVMVQGLALIGTDRLLAWLPSVSEWTRTIDFQVDLFLSLAATNEPKGRDWLKEEAVKTRDMMTGQTAVRFGQLLLQNALAWP